MDTAKLIAEPDDVYVSRAAADTALVAAARASELPAVIVSFFPASLARIKTALACAGIAGENLATAAQPVLPPKSEGVVWLLDARRMTSGQAFDAWLLRSRREARFLFVEHHPLLAVEGAALDLLEAVSATHPQRVRFFVGLDEPWMAAFHGERVVGLMKALGMDMSEKLSHPMIDKAIGTARAKLSKRVKDVVPADSDTEWFARNLAH